MHRRAISKSLFGVIVGAALPGEPQAAQPIPPEGVGIARTRGEIAAAVMPVNLAYPPYHGLRYGMDTTGKTDCTAQLQSIIDAATREYHHTVTLPHGIIRIDGVITIAEGVMIVGEGSQGSTDAYGTTIVHRSNGDCFVWNGAGAPFAGTGGGLKNVLIVKEDGFSGGIAVSLVAKDDDHRPGEMLFENVLIFGVGKGRWSKGLLIDGRNCDTAGRRGIRSTHFNKFRVGDCTSDNQYIHIRQATHLFGNFQIDTGEGTANQGMTIDGDWNLIFITVRCGRLIVNYSGTSMPALGLSGHCDRLELNHKNIIGNVQMSVGSTATSQAKLTSIASFKADACFVHRTKSSKNVTGAGTTENVVCNARDFDRNGSYDPESGVFTVKCAGIYQVEYAITLAGLDETTRSGRVSLRQRRAGGAAANDVETTLGNVGAMRDAEGALTVKGSSMLECLEGDTLDLRIAVSGGARDFVDVVGAPDAHRTWFAARLLA
jgi:hypothetical protein